MQVLETHIVNDDGILHQLFICKGDKYFITHNGAFGQRETGIKEIPESRALKLITNK